MRGREAIIAAALAGVVLAAACAWPGPRAGIEAVGEATAFTNVTLIDGTGAPPRRGVTVLVRDRRVAEVFAAGAKQLPPGTAVVDGTGRYLIPGLIDAHIHLGTMPNRPRNVTEAILANAFMGGVTAARDMGGQTATVVPLAARAAEDTTPWPRVYYSALLAGPGTWFEGARGRFMAEGGAAGSTPLVRLIADTTDVRAAVAAARRAGASGLKLYNTIPLARVRELAREAHRQGLRVWSHLAVDPARPSELVEAGVDVVSHADQFVAEVLPYPPGGVMVEDFRAARHQAFQRTSSRTPAMQRVLAEMRRRGTMLDPTLFVMTPSPDSTGRVPERAAALYRFATDMVRAAHAAGVPIVAGTDALGGSTPNIHVELQLLVDSAGLTPPEALRAATANAAVALGVADSLGTVAVGKLADLVLLRADPLADIANTQTVVGVMKAGRWHPRAAPMRSPPRARPPR